MKILNLFFFLLFLNVGCSEQTPLSGEIVKNDDWKPKIYLIKPLNFEGIAASYVGEVIDSAEIDANGRFTFAQMPDAPEAMLLELAVQKKGEIFPNQLDNDNPTTSNYFPFIWRNGVMIRVSAQIDAFQKTISFHQPAPENAAMLHLRNIRLAAFEQFLSDSPASHDAAQLLDEEKATLNFQKVLMTFADSTAFLYPALTAIRWVSVKNDYERVPEFLYRQCQRWQTSTNNAFAAQLCNQADPENLPVMVGMVIPNYPMPMLSKQTENLHDLLGEKLTILDLWASWCVPCRKENRNYLVPLWEAHHPKGLQILGYGLEADENAWKNAIKKDGADRWLHASDMQGDAAPFLEELKISTIPANFLIDANGKILAKNLHGEELVDFVKKFFEN